MNALQIIALGTFINGAAHYVRDGQSFWYAAWMCIGTFIAYASDRMNHAYPVDAHRHKG